MDTPVLQSPRIEKLAALLFIVVTVFVGLLAVDRLLAFFEPQPAMGNVITVQGEGRISAVPDIAVINFTVSEEATNASGAQDAAAKKVNTALALVRQAGVEDKDIKTVSYNVSPKYSNPSPCYSGYCPDYEQRIVGYTAYQNVEVKVRETDDAGAILSSLGDAGVSNLSGPNFTIDDIEVVRAEAREEAIKDARAKAKELAKDLGVSLVRIASFSENGGPIYYGYGKGGVAMDAAMPQAMNPELPTGENETVITVMISYEIR